MATKLLSRIFEILEITKKFEEKIYLKKSLKIKICKNVQYV